MLFHSSPLAADAPQDLSTSCLLFQCTAQMFLHLQGELDPAEKPIQNQRGYFSGESFTLPFPLWVSKPVNNEASEKKKQQVRAGISTPLKEN